MTTSSNISQAPGRTSVVASVRRAVPAILVAALVVAALGGWYVIIAVGLGSLR
jgi:hypothetical protein